MTQPSNNPTDARRSLTALQVECIRLIVEEGRTSAEVKRLYHIQDKTWYVDWRDQGLFWPAMEDARRTHQEGVWSRIRSAGAEAVETLHSIMVDPMEKSTTRVACANSLLDRGGFKVAEVVSTAPQPYASREDLVAAIADIPADILEAALAARRGTS